MLKINISARGKEHYAVFYPEKEFNEDEFMEEHSPAIIICLNLYVKT